jgi:hypothetical protein
MNRQAGLSIDHRQTIVVGPGEAKGELERRLHKRLGSRVVGIETVDKMTPRQIAARVRGHFKK